MSQKLTQQLIGQTALSILILILVYIFNYLDIIAGGRIWHFIHFTASLFRALRFSATMTFTQVFGHFRHCLEGPEEHGINQGVGSVKFNVICIMLLAVSTKSPSESQ